MKKLLSYLTFIVAAAFLSGCAAKSVSDSKATPQDPEIEKILSTMTLKDKVGEMTQLSIDMVSKGVPYQLKEPHQLDTAKLKEVLLTHRVGSILNCGGHAYTKEHWNEIIQTIQTFALQKETKIPVLYGIDAVHGTNYTLGATLFPQQIGQGASWDTSLAKIVGEVTAYETRASSIPWTFAPVMDVGRDPRWPRLWETYGEDPYLVGQMGKAFIQGAQQDDLASPYAVASCLKHFLGYSRTLSGKDRTPAWVPYREIKQLFLPPFIDGIKAGAPTVMINSGEINGTPVHTNKHLLTDLLKEELSFSGLAVTDWEDIKYLVSRHKVAATYKEAIHMAIEAGIDMAMVPMDLEFPVLLKELVEEGTISEARIDESVRRILTVKKQLGLFESPIPEDSYEKFGGEEFYNLARKAAEESITLLKNQNQNLPLPKEAKILLCGPNADSKIALNGGWTYTWQGMEEKYYEDDVLTLKDAMEKKWGSDQIIYTKGADTDSLHKLATLKQAAIQVDHIVICLGELGYTEKVGDLFDLDLPEAQQELVKVAAEFKKPITLVLLEGRPRVIRAIEPLAKSIVLGYYPGNGGAEALVSVLSGEVNPSGKLPYTYPKYANDLLTYDHKHTETIDQKFGNEAFQPQWEFGYGLSYTEFEYTELSISKSEFNQGEELVVSVKVTNTGERDGKEVVQLYYNDEVASITPEVKKLLRFQKIAIKAGETQKVTFAFDTKDLRFVNADNEWVIEPGEFNFMVGPHSVSARLIKSPQ